jgi:hypothetical protein
MDLNGIHRSSIFPKQKWIINFRLILCLGTENKQKAAWFATQPGGIKRMLLRPKVKKPNTSLGVTTKNESVMG